MADITVRNQGNVSDEGLVNWRGDQMTITPGDQSVYDSSTVQLADLGARKVVGDRIFRYGQAGGTINPSEVVQVQGTGVLPAQLISVTAGTVNQAGGRIFNFYFATSYAANAWAEGYLYSQSGTAANMGQHYRIKSHASVGDTSKVNLVLYDPLKLTSNVTDKWSLSQNPYKYVTQNSVAAGTNIAVGVCVTPVTTGDYAWFQTWGPCNVKAGVAVSHGANVIAATTGQVAGQTVVTGTVPNAIGYAMQVLTVSERGLVFLTIAP